MLLWISCTRRSSDLCRVHEIHNTNVSIWIISLNWICWRRLNINVSIRIISLDWVCCFIFDISIFLVLFFDYWVSSILDWIFVISAFRILIILVLRILNFRSLIIFSLLRCLSFTVLILNNLLSRIILVLIFWLSL